MPRALRIHVPGGFYHVTLRGNHQQRIFVDEGDQRLLNLIVARALSTSDARLHAYCWMSNHVHLLVQVGAQPLANPMRNIASEFARAMQKKLSTTGHFFERRYHAKLVDTDAYLMELVRYIHLNPVRAGVVDRPALYPWSSHHVYVGSRDEPWVTTDFALRMFARDPVTAVSAYLRFLDDPDAEDWTPERLEPEREAQTQTTRDFQAPAQGAARITLDQLIDEACERFTVSRWLLQSPIRDRGVSKVRAWIARQATKQHVCSLTAVAKALKRNESSLRSAMRTYANDAV